MRDDRPRALRSFVEKPVPSLKRGDVRSCSPHMARRMRGRCWCYHVMGVIGCSERDVENDNYIPRDMCKQMQWHGPQMEVADD